LENQRKGKAVKIKNLPKKHPKIKTGVNDCDNRILYGIYHCI